MSSTKPKTPHPNRVTFSGCLTKLGQPSDGAPSGSRGHRVMLTHNAAAEALESLEDMGVGFTENYDGHDARRKCGIIKRAWIEGDDLMVAGFIYGKDFPDVRAYIDKHGAALGMSFEMADAHVRSMKDEIWVLTKVTFTGAAILKASKAAYRSTRFNLQAGTEEQFNGTLVFTTARICLDS